VAQYEIWGVSQKGGQQTESLQYREHCLRNQKQGVKKEKDGHPGEVREAGLPSPWDKVDYPCSKGDELPDLKRFKGQKHEK